MEKYKQCELERASWKPAHSSKKYTPEQRLVNSSTSMLAKDLQELSKYYKVEEIKAVDSHMYQSYVTSIAKLTKK